MDVKIFSPAKNAMQSGLGKAGRWKLEFVQRSPLFIEPLMGWVGMRDTTRELSLFFDSQAEAVAFAEKNGLSYKVFHPKSRTLRPKSYADNFRFDRVTAKNNH